MSFQVFRLISLSVSCVVFSNNDTRGNYYVSGAGRTMGISALIDVEQQHSLAMAKSIYGAEVVIHDANEFPQRSLTSAVAQPGRDLSIAIIPSVTISRETIRSLPVAERNCYFADEEKLRATRRYSLNSCLAECRVDHIIAKCNCLPFVYPEIPAIENKYRQCGLMDVACLRTYRSEWTICSRYIRCLITIYRPSSIP